MKAPRPITAAHWVVAAFDQRQPRFLARDRRGHWVVVTEPERAMTFADDVDAHAALDSWRRFGHGDFRVWQMSTRASFAPA